jgi:hypothetical protein
LLHVHSTHSKIPFCLAITFQIVRSDVVYTLVSFFLDVLSTRMATIMASWV